MSNGQEFLNDLDFTSKIKKMDDRSLLEFTAEQVYENCQLTQDHNKRIVDLESRDKKFAGAVGGISGIIGAAIVAAINYFTGAKG